MSNEKKEAPATSSQTIDPNLRAILDAMQKQNERHEAAMINLHKAIQDESIQRMREVEMIGKKLGLLETGLSSIAASSEFGSAITDDASVNSRVTTRRTTREQPNQPRSTARPIVSAAPPRRTTRTTHPDPASDQSEDEQPTDYSNPQYSAKTCLDFIPTLNGQDDIGVEGFIKTVREARAECRDKRLLLKLIIAQKIIGDAERSIRHAEIENFSDLFEVLRKFVSISITSSGARDKLHRTRQGHMESVHSFVKRFRSQLNELIYALQHEVTEPVRRAVAIDLERERATKTFLLNLKPDIEARTSSTKPQNLQEAQEAAFEAELFLGEIERARNIYQRPAERRNPPVKRLTVIPNKLPNPMYRTPNTTISNPVKNINPPKCFKCQQIGHLANQCPKQNFPLTPRKHHPPLRNNNMTVETEYESTPPPADYSPYEQLTNTEREQDFLWTPEQE